MLGRNNACSEMWSGVGWQVDIGQVASLPMPLFPSGNIEPRTLFLALRSELPATQRAQVLNCFVSLGTLIVYADCGSHGVTSF